jgi:ATP synthase protein I
MQQDQQEPAKKHRGLQDSEQLSLERLSQASRRQVFRFVLAQLSTTFVLSAILLFFDCVVAYSSLAGGLIATLANAWFAVKVFRVKPTEAAETLLTTIYVGEIYKFVLTGALFIIAFVLIKPLSVVALLITYFIVHMTPAVLNVFDRSTQQRPDVSEDTLPEDEK